MNTLLDQKDGNEDDFDIDVAFDKVEWQIPEEHKTFVNELAKNTKLSNEDKILCLFERLSTAYTYDDNLLSYINKVEDDKFALPDWYGRDINSEWEENRALHNKRVCYEMSRYLAKALTEIFMNKPDYSVCILWDEDLTHYFVGLTCSKYTLTLDLDNFENIKDLTRVKTGLTIDGIRILEDNTGKFTETLNLYNSTKNKHAIKAISSEIRKNTNVETQDTIFNDNVVFFSNAVEILKEKYDIDSQGMFEYMKEIADIRLGSKSREKIWKRIKDNSQGNCNKYIRCLLLSIPGEESEIEKYIIDVDKREFRRFDEKELEGEEPEFIAFKQLTRNWDEHYDGK